MAQIVTIGEILVEIMATRIGQTFLEPGLFAGPYPSGAPAIFADQAARVGAADRPDRLRRPRRFRHAQPRTGCEPAGSRWRAIRRVPGTTTGSAFVTYRADGGRDFIFNIANSAAAALDAAQLEPGLFRGCRFFHVMGSSLFSARIAAAVRRGVELAKAAGAQISFDPNIRKELLGLPEVADDHRGGARGQRRPAAERRRPRPSLPRPVGSRGRGEPARRRPADGAAEEGRAGQRLLRRRPSDRDAGLPGRGGRPDRRRRLLRRHLRRLPGAGRAAGAGAASGQRGRRPGGRQEGADGGQFDHGRARGVPGAAAR